MTSRGPYRKSAAKRAEILETALEVIDRNGFSGATVKELAEAVGMSQNGMLYYFGSKDNLFLEVLRLKNDAVAVEIDLEHTDFAEGLATRILDAVTANVRESGFSELLLSMLTAGSTKDHIAHEFFRERYESFRVYAKNALEELQRRGGFPAEGDAAAAADVIASAFDGLQLKWMYDPTIDVRGRMAYLLDSLRVTDEAVQPAVVKSS